MKALDFQISWPTRKGRPEDAADATFANLRLMVGGDNVTTYVDEDDPRGECERVEQPMLEVAEWIAANWWALLWEPEKSELEKDEETKADDSYRFRHSLMMAQRGFALPDLRFIPTGDDVRLLALPRHARHARARFTRHADLRASREEVEGALRSFMDDVVGKLGNWGDHPVAEAWAAVTSTPSDAAAFCRMMGALGLTPYIEHRRIEAALDRVSDRVSAEELFDLCLTSTPDEFVRASHVATILHERMPNEDEIDLRRLQALSPPADPIGAPAYRRGQEAARKLRSDIGVDDDDIDGATKVLGDLQIDWRARAVVDLKGASSPIAGAIRRHHEHGAVAFTHEAQSSRRFAAARAAYMFWTGRPEDRRLMTSAVTRDQQASRAFAAEILVPRAFVRREARRSRISRDQISAIAERAMVAEEVVRHQATNSGLQLTR